MKTVKVDCTPNPAKVIQVEIPDGSRWMHGDKNETTEINGKKYRIIKVMKAGVQIGIIDRLEGEFQYVEQDINCNRVEPGSLGDKPVELKPIKDETIASLVEECCNLEPPYRQEPITDAEIKKIDKSCSCCKPVGPQEPVKIKEGKIKSFFKRLFRIK